MISQEGCSVHFACPPPRYSNKTQILLKHAGTLTRCIGTFRSSGCKMSCLLVPAALSKGPHLICFLYRANAFEAFFWGIVWGCWWYKLPFLVCLRRRDLHSSMLSTTRWNISQKHSEFPGLFGSLGMVVTVDNHLWRQCELIDMYNSSAAAFFSFQMFSTTFLSFLPLPSQIEAKGTDRPSGHDPVVSMLSQLGRADSPSHPRPWLGCCMHFFQNVYDIKSI